MFNSIWEDIKQQFRYGNMLTQIILVNTGVFLLVNLLLIILFFVVQDRAGEYLDGILRWFEASYDPWHNLTRPWTIFTYMFLHKGLFHYAFNMIFLYIYGRLFVDFLGSRRILSVYVMGGLMGFLFYVLSSFIFPERIGLYCLGASAGVWGVVMATTVLRPDHIFHLMFIGPVRLKYITMVFVVLAFIGITGSNTGGEMAHIGGMLAGWLFMFFLKEKGTDLSIPFNKVWDPIADFFINLKDKLFGKPKLRTSYKSDSKSDWEAFRHGRGQRAPEESEEHGDDQEKIDEILDKINRSGYSSLSKEEKEFLFKASKK